MVQDVSHSRRRTSFTKVAEGGQQLKNMMNNLLPSLDASMDSHHQISSMEFSQSEATTASLTAYHTSASSGACIHSDLGDSSEEEDVQNHHGSRRSLVKNKLKSAFSKLKKSSHGGSNGKKNNKISNKKQHDNVNHNNSHKEKEKKKSSKSGVTNMYQTCHDDVSVDDTYVDDPPTVVEPEPAPTAGKVNDNTISDDSDMVDRQRRSAKPRRSKSASGKGKMRHTKSSDSSELDNSSENVPPQRKSATANITGSNSKRSSASKDLKRARSSRRTAASGSNSNAATGMNTGKRLPPRSKSFDGDEVQKVSGRGGNRPDMPARASSFAVRELQPTTRTRSSSVKVSGNTPSGSSQRPSTRKSQTAATEPRSSNTSSSRRPSSNNPNSNKAISRSRSFRGEEKGQQQREPAPTRSRSFTGLLQGDSDGKGRAPRRRSSSRSSHKKKTDSTSSATPTVLCRHGEKLGECCYEQSSAISKATATPPLFSFDDHFGAEHATDEVSIDTFSADLNNHNSLYQFLVMSNNSNGRLKVEGELKAAETAARDRQGRRSKSRSRSPSEEDRNNRRSLSRSRSQSRSRSPSEEDRRRSLSRARSQSRSRSDEETERRRSLSRTHREAEAEERRRSLSRKRRNADAAGGGHSSGSERERERDRRATNFSVERKSKNSNNNATYHSERDRSQSRSRRPSTAQSKRGRSKSVSRRSANTAAATAVAAARERSTSKRPSSKTRARSRSASKTRKETTNSNNGGGTSAPPPRKQYATLTKEDLFMGGTCKDAANRRPRSLSRSRRSGKEGEDQFRHVGSLLRNEQPRISRSLSRTRKGSSKEQEGIGNYLLRQQPERTPVDDEETNSQTTGSNTTGSNEVTYKTPSWMWSGGQNSASLHNSFQTQTSVSVSDLHASTSTNVSIGNSSGTNQTGNPSYGSNSYDASAEMSSSNGSSFANSSAGGSNNQLLQSSVSSLPVTATPGTRAKHLYGKIMKREQEEIRAQSALLFQNVTSVHAGAVNQQQPSRSMFAPLTEL